jgi:hypothetical protein
MSVLGSRNVVGGASGALLGAVVGLLVGAMLDLLGSFLTIFEAFKGDGSGSWTFLVISPVALALTGAAIGGFLGVRRARRHLLAGPAGGQAPQRPDTQL